VAVGRKGAVTSSRDGITWTARTGCPTSDWLRGVAYGKGLFVAVDGEGRMYGSTDGSVWAKLGTQPTPFRISYSLDHLAYDEAHDTFTVVGDKGKIYTMLYVLCSRVCVCVCMYVCVCLISFYLFLFILSIFSCLNAYAMQVEIVSRSVCLKDEMQMTFFVKLTIYCYHFIFCRFLFYFFIHFFILI
jgi:hypothetical protein